MDRCFGIRCHRYQTIAEVGNVRDNPYSHIDETKFNTEEDVINAIVDGHSQAQMYYSLFFYAVCWSAQIRIAEKVNDIPSWQDCEINDPRFQKYQEKHYYYQRQHLLNEAMDRLGVICRETDCSPGASALFQLLDLHCQERLFEQYEFRRKVQAHNRSMSLKAFALCVKKENHLLVNGYELWPADCEEQTDDYGQPTWKRTWVLKAPDAKTECFGRLDGERIVAVYRQIFGGMPKNTVDGEIRGILDSFRTGVEMYQEEGYRAM